MISPAVLRASLASPMRQPRRNWQSSTAQPAIAWQHRRQDSEPDDEAGQLGETAIALAASE